MKKLSLIFSALVLFSFASCKKDRPSNTAKPVDVSNELKTKINQYGGLVNLEIDNSDPQRPFYYVGVAGGILKVGQPIWDQTKYPVQQTGLPLIVEGLGVVCDGCSVDVQSVELKGGYTAFSLITYLQGYPNIIQQVQMDWSSYDAAYTQWYNDGVNNGYLDNSKAPKLPNYVKDIYYPQNGGPSQRVDKYKIVFKTDSPTKFALAVADYPSPTPKVSSTLPVE
ncbi:hypothetical protein [Mucilaginibacter sp. 44-25]|uniref:hypothetical protein n=1 Tax=Mucilaginibacter sp. 44-25 TaxID=1895794 RepID=UPI00095DA8CE|nr:hypothetical protein [Mucilaginibacter sp. 44-25]OJW13375.1 MAG: hypothetical protein BGO48_01055 [Mucilaginibacter sp. 44-25]